MISRVFVGESLEYPSIGVRRPRTRTIGGAPTVNVTMGTCIGGSCVVTGGVCFRVPEHISDRWATEMGMPELTSARLDPWSWVNRSVEYSPEMCPQSLDLLGRAVHLDVSPELSPDQIDQIACAVRKVLLALV